MSSPTAHSKDPLHGVKLETIVTTLQERYGWEEMGYRIPIRCFNCNPSVKSSLTFLRKTEWARKRVEEWFVADLLQSQRNHPEPQTGSDPNGAGLRNV